MSMGITTSVLIIAGPILNAIFSPNVSSYDRNHYIQMPFFSPSEMILFVIFSLLVGLGLIMILKDLDISLIKTIKGYHPKGKEKKLEQSIYPKVKEKTLEQTICVHCGAFMKPGSQVCKECGIELII
ncbi:MAG: hypothetical protein ACFFBP_02625 [Promethearchaeota archaeon]